MDGGAHPLPMTPGHSRPHPKLRFHSCETGNSHPVPPRCSSATSLAPGQAPTHWDRISSLSVGSMRSTRTSVGVKEARAHVMGRRGDMKVFDGFRQTMKPLAGREVSVISKGLTKRSYCSSKWNLPFLLKYFNYPPTTTPS